MIRLADKKVILIELFKKDKLVDFNVNSLLML